MSFWQRNAALSRSVAWLLGIVLGTFVIEVSIGQAVCLAALGLALGGRRRGHLALVGAGLAWVTAARPAAEDPDLARPATVHVRIAEPWRMGQFGPTARAQAEWLRQGIEIRRWHQPLQVYLPSSVPTPDAARLRLTGYLRRTHTLANGFGQRSQRWQLRINAGAFVEVDTAWRSRGVWPELPALGARLRARLEDRLDESIEHWPWRTRLVRALVLGRFDALPESTQRSLRVAGLAHLFALSGLHIGLLAACASQLLVGSRTGLRALVIVFLILVYGLLVGDRPSLVRSTIMLFAVLGSARLRRPSQPVNTLAWVGGVMLLVRPGLIRDVGFQLSFAATAGLLVLAPQLYRRWACLPPWLRLPLSVSVGAHLAGLPWALALFHLECPLAPLTFLAILPWTVASLSLALLWAASAVAWPWLSALLDPALELMGRTLEAVLEVPWSRALAFPSALDWPVAVIIAGALVVVLVGGRRWILAVVVLGTVGMLVAADRPAAPELVVLDIGQGDAILLRDGATALLVDGGGWQNGDIAQSVLVPALAHLGVRHLAGVALTHPDVDHCAGLVGLASYLPIDRLLLSPGWADSRCVDRLLVLPGVRVKPLWRGESFNLGRWRIRTLHPAAGQRRGRNNRSLVLLATLASHRVLLTGDLERQGESQILDVRGAGELPAVDLLKVGHHGSATSTSRPWLDRLQPRLALISCGLENRYGHPADEVVERLGHHRARVLRTDRDGAIRIAFVAPGHWRITLLGPG